MFELVPLLETVREPLKALRQQSNIRFFIIKGLVRHDVENGLAWDIYESGDPSQETILMTQEKDDEILTEHSSFGGGDEVKESRHIKEDLVTECEG